MDYYHKEKILDILRSHWKIGAFLAILILVFIVLRIIKFVIVFKYRKQIKTTYNVSVSSMCNIRKSDSNLSNHFVLEPSRWQYANKNGCRDKRYKNNQIIRGKSKLYVDKYIIETTNLREILRLVYDFRDNGVFIEINTYERLKSHHHKNETNWSVETNNIQRIISRFSNHPRGFEEFCAELYRNNGYYAQLTPATNDGGYDIILTRPQTNEKLLVECKCFALSNKVGRPHLQKLYGASATLDAVRLIFITTSDYSKSAIEYGKQVGIEMINGKQLVNLLDASSSSKSETRSLPEWKTCQLTIEDLVRFQVIPKDLPI